MKTTTLIMGLTLAVAGAAHGQFFPERDPADVNGDGLINSLDLAEVLGRWGPAEPAWAVVLERCPDPNVVTDETLREAIAATGLPWRVQDLGTGIEMLLVPPGTFMMGCSASEQSDCYRPESPVHEVTLTRAFYLGRYEVTQAQWASVMGTNPSLFATGEKAPMRPVEQVPWNLVAQFLADTDSRLPTEAEWEYACRAGTTTAFNNGSDDNATLGDIGWYVGNADGTTHPVGLKTGNGLGLHDMHGNVWEWVSDWYGDEYYATSPATDPQGPTTGTRRVLRGGPFSDPARNCRSSVRASWLPSTATFRHGFRVARTP